MPESLEKIKEEIQDKDILNQSVEQFKESSWLNGESKVENIPTARISNKK